MLSSGPPSVGGPHVWPGFPVTAICPSRRGSAVSPGTGPVGPPRSQGRVLHTCGWGCGYVGAAGLGGRRGCVARSAHTGRQSGTRRPERDEAAVVEGLHDDAAAIWTACLESLDGAGSTHKAWLAQIRPVAVSGDTLVLAVPDEFVKEWIEQRYAPTVVTALGRVASRPLGIRVTVGPLEDNGDEEQLRPVATPRPAAERPQLTPKYTFERFVIGSSNRFAHAAAVAVAEAPAKSYNPLFIYGGAGLGKTHLLHAIGHYTGNLYPQARIPMCPASSSPTSSSTPSATTGPGPSSAATGTTTSCSSTTSSSWRARSAPRRSSSTRSTRSTTPTSRS